MSRLGPYNQRQIDGDFVLTELQKLYKKTDPVKFKLTQRYNAFGDSYGAADSVQSWVRELNDILGTVANNQCASGATINIMALGTVDGKRNSVSLMTDPDFDCSTICMYGVNDSRNELPFFQYYPCYYNTALASYLMASIPQSGIVPAKSPAVTVLSGEWTEGPYEVERRTLDLNAKLSVQVSGRFLAVFTLIKGDNGEDVQNNNNPWRISVNGVLESDITRSFFITPNNSEGFYLGVRVIDTLVAGTTKTLVLENMDTMGNLKFVWGFAGWDANSPLARNVLVATPTITDGFNIGSSMTKSIEFDSKHLWQKNAQIAAVNMCKSLGLPVFIHDTPYETEYRSDALHLNQNGTRALAEKMVKSIGSLI